MKYLGMAKCVCVNNFDRSVLKHYFFIFYHFFSFSFFKVQLLEFEDWSGTNYLVTLRFKEVRVF